MSPENYNLTEKRIYTNAGDSEKERELFFQNHSRVDGVMGSRLLRVSEDDVVHRSDI